ncbi:glycosyltransferase [Synechococcus sp. NOUM97013]|uniref:glycosyltransferase n=1 Tax=Synechococcus sp. NOUM97013 TaxID=1442555 RepID=UPI0016441337|nr:glycosyltransferase [Synechococcus sp. NOUM97013]
MSQRPPLTLIVGMHRSGTSLLGSLLPACGIAMPGPLIAGDTHNPEGYFERADITALQEQLLIDLERWWPSPRGMHRLPQNWLTSEPGQQALKDLIALLQVEAERQQGPWAIKDPRSSLLLPLWKQACLTLKIPLQLLLAVRDPAEVMVSLVRRDQAVTGMDGWRAQRLWWHHNAQVLRDGADLPLQVVSYSHWFTPDTALKQVNNLAPEASQDQQRQALKAVKPEHRRSRLHDLPTPLFRPVQAMYQRLNQLALQPVERQRPVRQALEQWLNRQPELPAPAPLPRRRSRIKQRVKQWLGKPAVNRVAEHPWGALAELSCGSQGPAAEHQLHFWETQGFRSLELERIALLAGSTPAAEPWSSSESAITLQVRGGDLNQWPVHAWIQHCPIERASDGEILVLPFGRATESLVALNLMDVCSGQLGAEELLALAQLERVWDPDRDRVRLLRQFGVNASWLHPHQTTNGYLTPMNGNWDACAETLGLAAPEQLRCLGTTLCLGTESPALSQELHPPLLGIPGFNGLTQGDSRSAHLLAQWLQGCLSNGLELVRQQITPEEQQMQGWQVLRQTGAAQKAPILILNAAISGRELQQELHWYRQGCPPAEPCQTPAPSVRVLFDQDKRQRSRGLSVCISLYNYGARILDALNSVLAQSEAGSTELIVVDDASSDDSAAVVRTWMQEHHPQLGRCLLLQHNSNGGLAAARNTAFRLATSPWCFVLDADNQLEPLALQQCGQLARHSAANCAVVHSLVRVQAEQGSDDPRVLVSDTPWQQQLLRGGNYIDAMALVRREAWEAIGGYTHIPGGWEDFDFWCSLIDAGWHGVLCPQVLATYTSHSSSMRAESTTKQERRLSRLLQARHPWLDLPQCHDQAIWPPSKG